MARSRSRIHPGFDGRIDGLSLSFRPLDLIQVNGVLVPQTDHVQSIALFEQ